MGGYMGFGMQKWIYSRKPRKKLYVKERIQSFTALPKYSRTFTLKPSVVDNKIHKGMLTILVVISFIIIITSAFSNFKKYSNEHTKQVTNYINYKNKKAFNFLVYSGKNRLRERRILGAYSEFKLAYSIYPNNIEIQQLLNETLSILCEDNSDYCNELDKLLLRVNH
jgi:hypothetical protein